MLDSPSQEYVSKYLKRIETIPGFGAFPELDEEGLKAAEDAFEAQCKERCLELAAQATEADPTNVDWWRLRALLIWRYSMYSYDDSPRVDNWLEILQDASQHDPENALYDYLAAHFYWESSAEVDFQGETEQLAVKDAERFDRGVHHFEQGQKRTFFVVGDAGFAPAVLAEADRHFQENIAFARKPSDHWSKVQRAVERVRADQELIDQLRGKAVTEIAEERSSESE